MNIDDTLSEDIKRNALMYEGTSLQGRAKLMERLFTQAKPHADIIYTVSEPRSTKRDSVTELRKLMSELKELNKNVQALGNTREKVELSGVSMEDVAKMVVVGAALEKQMLQAIAKQEFEPDLYRPDIQSLKSPLTQARTPRYEKFGPADPASNDLDTDRPDHEWDSYGMR